MAGIGFELKKVFRKSGFFNVFKGVLYASASTIGPIILVITALLAINTMMNYFNIPYFQREILSSAILYAFVFSLIIATSIGTVLSRYISDKIFNEEEEDIIPSLYGSIALVTCITGILGIPFYISANLNYIFSFGAYSLLMILSIVFVLMHYVSAIKEYRKITAAFLIGILLGTIIGSILFYIFKIELTYVILYSMTICFFFTAIYMLNVIRSFFKEDSKKYFEFLEYFREYKLIFISGLFYILGLYVHNFIFWFSPIGNVVADTYRCSYTYDMASFLGMFTNLSATVIFVVKVETNFHQKYQRYCYAVMGGSLNEIKMAKKDMSRVLNHELFFITEVQLIITLTLICAGIALLPMFGFGGSVLDIYPILALGYYAVFMMYFLIVFLYYFDDQKGAVYVSGIFLITTILMSILTVGMGVAFYGLGLLIGGIFAWIAGFFRLKALLKDIDYHMFCNIKEGKESEQSYANT